MLKSGLTMFPVTLNFATYGWCIKQSCVAKVNLPNNVTSCFLCLTKRNKEVCAISCIARQGVINNFSNLVVTFLTRVGKSFCMFMGISELS